MCCTININVKQTSDNEGISVEESQMNSALLGIVRKLLGVWRSGQGRVICFVFFLTSIVQFGGYVNIIIWLTY